MNEKMFPAMEGSIAEIIAKEVAKQRNEGVEKMLGLHVRAMACHCECLGMNAENSLAVCNNTVPPYSDDHYMNVLHKWGLMDEKGNPII